MQPGNRYPNRGIESASYGANLQPGSGRFTGTTGSFLTGGGMPEKYQDEIEEILKRAGETPPSEPSQEGERRGTVDRGPSPVRASREAPAPSPKYRWRLPRISPGKVMLAGAIVLITGIWFWPLIWVGLALLAVSYLLFFVTPRSISYEKKWRRGNSSTA